MTSILPLLKENEVKRFRKSKSLFLRNSRTIEENMKKTLSIATVLMVLCFGCASGSDGDAAAGAAGITAGAGAAGIAAGGTTTTGASGTTAVGGTTGGAAGATAGASGGSATDPCPGGEATKDIVITTAAQLAAAANCTTVKGITITGNAITDLNALNKVTTVKGYLYIQDTKVTDLQGLSNVTTVEGAVYIGASLSSTPNPTPLKSLAGLEKLTTIGAQLQINENPQITDLKPLSNLKSIGSGKQFQFRNNSGVPTCDAQTFAKQIGVDPTDKNRAEICGTKSDSCGVSAECPPVT
jgi:hypothetical protein